ncbi:MAG: GatB/YqeY domain-containing protein, partial [Parcubacteria group bacterium]|nr:GatB/YqeY domain-containing protein [Parcubacteria group bacterium]
MIQKNISEQIKQAMLAKDALRLNVLRGLSSAFVNELVAQKKKPQEEISDEDAIDIIRRAVKQRKDSIEQFKKGGRE